VRTTCGRRTARKASGRHSQKMLTLLLVLRPEPTRGSQARRRGISQDLVGRLPPVPSTFLSPSWLRARARPQGVRRTQSHRAAFGKARRVPRSRAPGAADSSSSIRFDRVFTNAALFRHQPESPHVLLILNASPKPSGRAVYSSPGCAPAPVGILAKEHLSIGESSTDQTLESYTGNDRAPSPSSAGTVVRRCHKGLLAPGRAPKAEGNLISRLFAVSKIQFRTLRSTPPLVPTRLWRLARLASGEPVTPRVTRHRLAVV